MRRLPRLFLAAVWLAMGLGCKVLGLAPRHREIVARILGGEHADALTVLIGFGEMGMAAWILSGRFPRICAAVQIGLVGVMNVLEFILARDLLLFGGWNALLAAVFMILIASTELLPRRSPVACSPR